MSNASNDNQSDNDDLNRYYNELDTDLTELFSLDIELENFIPENYPIEQDTINTRHSELAQLEASDRYSILDKIDEGGMKDIWRAEDSHTDRMIAFAMIKEKSIPSDERYEAFIREARLTANLQHPNIVPIYDVSVDSNGIPFFTMKALKGENLEIIIEKIAAGDESYRARFTKMNLLSIFQRVCDAVAYAHSKGIIHLDLKPSNIIVCDYGEVQVIDWGISQFVDDIVNLPAESFDTDSTSDAMQSTHTICKVASISGDDTGSSQQYLAGSPGYMSPEQISGDIESIDHRTDIYSLGAILFFIQSGTKPVTGNDIKNLLENTTSGNITPLKQNKMPNQISKVLAAITIKALALNKADRYESVYEMQLDLNNYIDGFATIAESANFITHLKLLIRRHLLVTAVTILFLSLLTATITFSVISINKKRNEAETLLKNLKEKTAYISTLTEQVAPSCFDSAIRRYHDHEFDKYIHNLDLALSFDSSLDYIWNHKAHQFIAEQRFHQLMELFKKRSRWIRAKLEARSTI